MSSTSNSIRSNWRRRSRRNLRRRSRLSDSTIIRYRLYIKSYTFVAGQEGAEPGCGLALLSSDYLELALFLQSVVQLKQVLFVGLHS